MNKYKKKRKAKEIIFLNILLVISMLTVFCLVVALSCYLSYPKGEEYQEGYNEGYAKGCNLGYEAVYPNVYDSGYWTGYLEGCKHTTEEGFGIKSEIIDAYYSLLIDADLEETEQISFTYRFRQLIRVPVPAQKDAEKFISDIEEIISSHT